MFVIGAGASVDYKFPTGPTLLNKIADDLDFRFDAFGQNLEKGSHRLWHAIRERHHIENPADDINKYVYAGRRISAAASLATSIDNVIDQNNIDPLIPVVGKLAIADAIRSAEAASPLRPTPGNPGMSDGAGFNGTWLWELGRMMIPDIKATDAEHLFDTVSFVSFNYDRTIEFCLPWIIHVAYGLAPDLCKSIARTCRIWHPYGYLGPLPDGRGGGLEFGAEAPLGPLADEIHTFGESLSDTKDRDDWRWALQQAQRVVFLGFGYHRQNLELIKPLAGLNVNGLYGTVYGESSPSVASIGADLSRLCADPEQGRMAGFNNLVSITAAEMLQQYQRILTS